MEKIAVIGLGVVGIELAVHLAKYYTVQGYDINETRIQELGIGLDRHEQFTLEQLQAAKIHYCSNPLELKDATIYIVVVATPTGTGERPNLHDLKEASKVIAKLLKPGDLIIYESSVYPRTTEDFCLPILEEYSQLKLNTDFYLGYSPERYSPNDSDFHIPNLTKIIAASHPQALSKMRQIYSQICLGVHEAPSIATAECAKILENSQRMVNIALMNEFSQICHGLDIKISDVIAAAATKKNFLNFTPGLVGGHCIPVDPMYMVYQAKEHDVYPEVMIGAYKTNEAMTHFIINELFKMFFKSPKQTTSPRIGIFGITYKPNIPDRRHSLSLKLIDEVKAYGIKPLVHDPFFTDSIPLSSLEEMFDLDVCLLLVKHQQYLDLGLDFFIQKLKKPGVVMDVAHLYIHDKKPSHLTYWQL
jgi:UDP-N-acetyl-D-galactosamine dehydrogenase